MEEEEALLDPIEVEDDEPESNSVFYYFKRTSDTNLYRCEECDEYVNYAGGSFVRLNRHLREKHDIDVKEMHKNSEPKKPENEGKRDIHFKSWEERLVLLIASVGLSFRQVTSSHFRNFLIGINFQAFPATQPEVRLYLYSFADKVRVKHRKKIETIKQSTKFTVVIEEWMTTRYQKYLRIYLQYTTLKYFDLGVARVPSPYSPTGVYEVLEERLASFGVDFKQDVIAVVCNETCTLAQLRHKNKKQIPFQSSFAHILQAAIIETLYEVVWKPSIDEHELSELSDCEWGCMHNNDDWSCPINYFNLREDVHNEDMYFTFIVSRDIPRLLTKYEVPIRKTRALFRKFMESIDREDELLKRTMAKRFGESERLLIGGLKKWSTLLQMLENLFKYKDCLVQCLNKLRVPFPLSVNELTLLSELLAVLSAAKETIDRIIRPELNLIMAESLLFSLLQHLDSLGSDSAKIMSFNLKRTLSKARQKNSTVLHYLHTGSLQSPLAGLLQNQTVTIEQVQEYLEIFVKNQEPTEPNNESPSMEAEDAMRGENESLFGNHLEEVLNSSMKTHVRKAHSKSAVRAELDLFVATGERGALLEFVYKSLSTIKPSDKDIKSAYDNILKAHKKFKTKMSDKTLDALFFLKSYFASKDIGPAC